MTVREGTFWCCAFPENRKVVFKPPPAPGPRARAPGSGPRGPGATLVSEPGCPCPKTGSWFRAGFSSSYRPGMARGDRVPLIRVMGTRHGVRKRREPVNILTRGAPGGRVDTGGAGNLWGGPGVVPDGPSDGGDEDATLSKGGSDDVARVPKGI